MGSLNPLMKEGSKIILLKDAVLTHPDITKNERLELKKGEVLTYIGRRTPPHHTWGQVEYFQFEDFIGRLPEISVFAGAPPSIDESYYEAI